MTPCPKAFYEDQFRIHAMLKMTEENVLDLRACLQKLIAEHEQDHLLINRAYLTVKKDLIG